MKGVGAVPLKLPLASNGAIVTAMDQNTNCLGGHIRQGFERLAD